MRAFFQSLFHGLFINKHIYQLIGLILSDFAFIIVLFSLRKQFEYKANCISIILFFFFFLSFDVMLFIYTIDVNSNKIISSQTYEFCFLIIVLCMIGINFLKIVINFVIILYELIKKIKQSNKILQIKTGKNITFEK